MLAYKLWILSHTDRRVQHSNASCTLRRWILQLLQGERRLTARWAHSNRAQWANDWMQNRLSYAAVQYETSNRTDSIRTIRPFVRNRFVRFGESYASTPDDLQQKARIPTKKPALGIVLRAPIRTAPAGQMRQATWRKRTPTAPYSRTRSSTYSRTHHGAYGRTSTVRSSRTYTRPSASSCTTSGYSTCSMAWICSSSVSTSQPSSTASARWAMIGPMS